MASVACSVVLSVVTVVVCGELKNDKIRFDRTPMQVILEEKMLTEKSRTDN